MNWEDYFNNIVDKVKDKSKDPSTKVGCVIVNERNEPVSFGFNGWVSGCDETFMTWERPLKYNMVIHAEMNALIFAERNLKDCKAFVTHSPCSNCLKHLLQAGIREIYYNCPGIIRDRGTDVEKEAIRRLILSTGAVVFNVKTKESYIDEINIGKGSES